MAIYNELFSIPELIGKRINHTSDGYGPGTINNAWLDFDGSDHVTISFDYREEPTSSFGLMKCVRSGRIVFEDDGCDEAWLNELLVSENARRLDKMSKAISWTKQQPSKAAVSDNRQKTNSSSVLPTFSDLEDFDFFIETEPEIQLTPEQEQAEKEAVYKYFTKERGVQYLVHFTPIDNLQSILEHGILSRVELERLGVSAITPDQERLDFRLDYSSFSVSFPNYRIFYNKRLKTTHKYAVLLLDPKIILDLPYQSVSYLPENAASNKVWNIRRYRGLDAAKGMFPEEIMIQGNAIKRAELGIPDSYPTNPQAEVFIGDTVGAKYIKFIMVNNSDDYQVLKSTLSAPRGKDLPLISIGTGYFSARKDYAFWIPKKQDNQIVGE